MPKNAFSAKRSLNFLRSYHICIVQNLWSMSESLHISYVIFCDTVESTATDEIIKKFKFTDVDEVTKFSSSIRACLYYHPQVFKEPQ